MPADTPSAKPIRIQRKRTKGWKMPGDAVSVTRPGPFGNPFPICKCTSTSMGKTKDIWSVGTWNGPALWFRETKDEAAAFAVQAFSAWFMSPRNETLREKAKVALRGKSLACYCRLCPEHAAGKPFGVECAACDPCHSDILLEISNS